MAGELAGMFKSVSFESMAPAGAIDSNAKANGLNGGFGVPGPKQKNRKQFKKNRRFLTYFFHW